MRMSFVVIAGLLTASGAGAQPGACEEWAIVAADPRNNGRLQVCSAALREVPALRAQVDRLNAAAARSDDAQRDLARFNAALNELTRQMKAQDVNRLAASLAQRIEQNARDTDTRLMREIERLRFGMQDINEKLKIAGGDAASAAQAKSMLTGEAGQAIARLDLDTANKLLEGLADVAVYASNPQLFAQVRSDAQNALGQLRKHNAAQRCANGWKAVTTLHESAVAAEKRGQVNTAGATYKDVAERANAIVSELSITDSVTAAQNQATASLRAQQQQLEKQAFDLSKRRYEDRLPMATRFARSSKLQQELAQARQMAAQAEQLAREGRGFDAADMLVDAANLLGRIESEGGNYQMPMANMPKFPRPNLPRAAPAFDARPAQASVCL